MYYVHVPLPQDECNHYVLQTHTFPDSKFTYGNKVFQTVEADGHRQKGEDL